MTKAAIGARAAVITIGGIRYVVDIVLSDPQLMNVDEAGAISIARANAVRHGWRFVEPERAELRKPWLTGCSRWLVVPNHEALGSNVRTEIDHETGEILTAAYNPR